MSVYANQIEAAKRIIAARGEACIWHEGRAVADDDAEPWKQAASGDAEITHGCNVAFFPIDRQFAQLIRYARGSELVIGSLYGLMAAVDFAPAITGVIERSDGTKVGIASIGVLAPNGEVILYTIELKK